MADVKLSNTATIVGNYDAIPTTLDPTLIKLVEDTVQVNGAKADYTYDADTGLLTVTLETVATEGKAEITFQVQKV